MPARAQLLAVGVMIGCMGIAYGAGRPTNDETGIAYRWVDEKGVVHYGDRIPPQYTQKERSVLNRQGVEVGRLEAQKTPEQLREEARREQELVRQRQHDSFLLTTYTSVTDIEALRDARLDQIQGQRRAAEQYVENLHRRLSSLQSRAMAFRPYSTRNDAQRMPDDLAADIVRTLNEIRTQRNALATKDEEESAVRSRFQSDIDRYRELRTAQAASAR